ncbi:L-threonylcarbamoyladenylate synthase [Adhaeribacter aquaticus]|uniref:L-threonylcarbamoyladenylate synthase n=1 Tax=Adhaeribacter aquaticus TaxID=299567 RepID=UPI000418EE05|nr:L-threonylcarbamoyladenylate synthase [Adhaeribacter aquaticus]
MATAEYLKIHPDNPPLSKILKVIEVLQKGGIIIYPTDTIYGMGCDLHNTRAVEKLCMLKGIKPEKANLSFICSDLTHIADYARNISTSMYKVMKKALPGPFTFILEASSKVPKLAGLKKKTVGIRVPDHKIPLTLVKELGHPIISTSIRDEDEIIEYSTDPELIYEKYKNVVDLVIDGGFGNNIPSTVVDCISGECEVVRQGAGDIEAYI